MHTETETPEPAPMTDEQAVKAVHPFSLVVWRTNMKVCAIWSCDELEEMVRLSGDFTEPAEAWADARRRLASTGAETERYEDAIDTTPLSGDVKAAITRAVLGKPAPQQSPAQTQPADFPEMPVPQHHTSGYMRAEGAGEQGAVTESEGYIALCRVESNWSDDPRHDAHLALEYVKTLRAELDEALARVNQLPGTARLYVPKAQSDSWRDKCKAAEAACDAYKAALEEAREVVKDYIGYLRCEAQSSFNERDVLKQIDAALSRESTANSPAIADSSRDDAGAGKEPNADQDAVRVVRPLDGCVLGSQDAKLVPLAITDDRNSDPLYASILDMLPDDVIPAAAPASGKDRKQ